MAYNNRALVGVGGWLAVFIITLCLRALGTLVAAIGVSATPAAAQFGSGWTGYVAVTWLLAAAAAATLGYMAWRLNARHERETVRIVLIGLWAVALAPPVIDMVAGMALLGVTAGQLLTTEVAAVAKGSVTAAIWTAYLLRSERVANTYATDATDRLAAVFD